MVESSGLVVDDREMTASGAKIEKQDPYPLDPNFTGADTDNAYPFIGTVGKPKTGCTMAGIPIPDCSSILARINRFEYLETLVGVTFGRWIDQSTHIPPTHPPDDDDVIRTYTDAEKPGIWEEYTMITSFVEIQKTAVTEDDPDVLQGENNGDDCGIVVNFKPGTSYPGMKLPDGSPLLNGPSTMPDPTTGQPSFGLGFSVSGWVKSDGIGRIGSDKDGKVNPANPKGRWTIDQETAAWMGINGKMIEEKATFSDIPLGVPHSADGNRFSWYDHPGLTSWDPNYSRFENHIVKVYKGKTVCEVKFHFIQHGNNIHWGPGLL
jgi:hypothetical protein